MIIDEINEIIERNIPLGTATSRCHVGICPIEQCNRCQGAIKIREYINRKLEEQIEVMCECGASMIPMIEGPNEILYICSTITTEKESTCKAKCPQINVKRKIR